MAGTLISFLRLACPGSRALLSDDNRVLNVNKKKLLSLPFRLFGHIYQYNVIELLRNSGYGMNLAFPAHCHSPEFDWRHGKSSWYPYDFVAGLVRCVQATDEPGRRGRNHGAVLADHKLREVPVIFVEGESISLSEVKLGVHQFLAAQYPAILEEPLARASKEVASIEVLANDLEGEPDCDLANLTRAFH